MRAQSAVRHRLGVLAACLATLLALAGCGQAAGPNSRGAVIRAARAAPSPKRQRSKTPGASAPPLLPPLIGMYWASSTTGYVITGNTLYRTANDGASWTSWYHTSDITAVAGSGTASLWLAAGRSLREIEQTGQVARTIALPEAGPLQQMSLPSPGVALVRMAGHIYAHALGVVAGHWTNVSGPLGTVSAMVWLSSSDGYAVVGRTVWYTASGGQSWTKVFTAPVVGLGWTSQLVANSAQSVWLLLSGGVDGMSQTGFVLWHGTEEGTRWTAVTDEPYWAPTGYPSVHPAMATGIMQPGPLCAVGATTVYFAGWDANGSSHWVVLTNAPGSWHTYTIPITATTPQMFASQPGGSFVATTGLSFASNAIGFFMGESRSGAGALMMTTDAGVAWQSVTSLTDS